MNIARRLDHLVSSTFKYRSSYLQRVRRSFSKQNELNSPDYIFNDWVVYRLNKPAGSFLPEIIGCSIALALGGYGGYLMYQNNSFMPNWWMLAGMTCFTVTGFARFLTRKVDKQTVIWIKLAEGRNKITVMYNINKPKEETFFIKNLTSDIGESYETYYKMHINDKEGVRRTLYIVIPDAKAPPPRPQITHQKLFQDILNADLDSLLKYRHKNSK